MTKKILFYNIAIILCYMLFIYLFNRQKIIFPIFTISAFFFSMLLSRKEALYSFSLLYLVWIIHLFLPRTILSVNIIYLVFIPLTIWLGYSLKQKLWVYKVIYPAVLVLIGIYGFSNFYYYVKNFEARDISVSPRIDLHSNENERVRLDTIQNKIIVLDFWTTSCGVCFQKFPAYDELYLKYKDNPKVKMYTVNIPIKRDTIGYAKLRIERLNYSFPNLYADSDTLPKSLGFNGYPHLIIIKNGKTRFNGLGVMGRDDVFVNNLEDEIELLLNEDK